MKPNKIFSSAAILLILCSSSALYADNGISPEEFIHRRSAVASMLDSSSALLMKAIDARIRSNDVAYRYRQESNFLYCTGIEEPAYLLLIIPRTVDVNGKNASVIIFTPGDTTLATKLGPGEILLPTQQFSSVLQNAVGKISTLYLSAPDIKFFNDWLNEKPRFLDKEVRKIFEEKNIPIKIKNASVLFGKHREIKSASEIQQIKNAIAATGEGLTRAMKACAPGVYEYELQAEIEYAMTRRGAEYQGYPSIIGSGENALILHYDKNRKQMHSGEVVVMDVGAEVHGYSADITRTIPVNGKFTKPEKDLYSIVLKAQHEVIQLIRPGVPVRELDKKAREVINQAGYGKYFIHGVSHPLGLDTHDVSASDTLKAGMVLTVEPGIYIPVKAGDVASEYRGIGIRIEDDVLVTPDGNEVLSNDIPRSIRELERIMKKK